jgi:hypothetical protein
VPVSPATPKSLLISLPDALEPFRQLEPPWTQAACLHDRDCLKLSGCSFSGHLMSTDRRNTSFS